MQIIISTDYNHNDYVEVNKHWARNIVINIIKYRLFIKVFAKSHIHGLYNII